MNNLLDYNEEPSFDNQGAFVRFFIGVLLAAIAVPQLDKIMLHGRSARRKL